MVKVSCRTPAYLLLLPLGLVKDNLVIQCPHISINIAAHADEAATRVGIATSRNPDIIYEVTIDIRIDGRNYGCTE